MVEVKSVRLTLNNKITIDNIKNANTIYKVTSDEIDVHPLVIDYKLTLDKVYLGDAISVEIEGSVITVRVPSKLKDNLLRRSIIILNYYDLSERGYRLSDFISLMGLNGKKKFLNEILTTTFKLNDLITVQQYELDDEYIFTIDTEYLESRSKQ